MKNRLALWGALAVLAVGAVAIAVVAASDGDEGGEREQASADSPQEEKRDPQPLPVELSVVIMAPDDPDAVYVASDGLDAMGGEAEVFHLTEKGDPAAGVCPPDTGSRDQHCVSLGDYPLLDTEAAIERLNTMVAASDDVPAVSPSDPVETTQPPPVTARPAPPETAPPSTACILMLPDDGDGSVCDERPDGETPPATDPPITIEPPGGPTTTAAPPQPAPTDPPITVEPPDGPPQHEPEPSGSDLLITEIELMYVEATAWDGSGTYLLPAYRFTTAGGSGQGIPALPNEMFTAPE